MLNKISFYQNRRDEIPKQQLAKELAETENAAGIKEIAANLTHKNKSVQSDCLKVLYEIGYLKPVLIAEYFNDFLALLNSKNNRMVWGAMIALATIADKKPTEIYASTAETIRQTPHKPIKRFHSLRLTAADAASATPIAPAV